MIVKLRKGQKHSKTLKTIAIFNRVLLKFKILKSLKPFDCLKVSLAQRFRNLEPDFNFLKIGNIKFYQKIAKTGVTKILITIPITQKNYATAYYQTMEEVPRTWCRKVKRIQKTQKA